MAQQTARMHVGRVLAQSIYEQSSTKRYPLGTLIELADGRVFVYSQAGASALAAGLLTTYLTTYTHEDTVTVAHPVGTRVVTVTGAGVTANQYEDGYLVVTEGAGSGEMYQIKKNAAADGSNLVQVTLYDGIATAWVTSTTDVDLCENPYKAQVVNPVDAQQKPTTIPPIPVTAAYYYWGQVWGVAPLILTMATCGLELDEKVITASTSTAGEGVIAASPAAAQNNMHVVGYLVAEADIADSTATLIYLRLV